MKKTMQDKLYADYPELFRQFKGDKSSYSLGFGIECGDGWYWLIDRLCKCIQNYIAENNKTQVEVVQIKEKNGGLRFYTEHLDNIVWGMIWFAEQLSHTICESCGSTDARTESASTSLGIEGWQRTLCGTCRLVFGDVNLEDK